MILVTGVSGQLGSAFRRLLGKKATFLTRAELDLEQKEAIPEVVERYRPATLINCAAFTAVDKAEKERDRARRVNELAVAALAGAAKGVGAKFITFSTDYVFDGASKKPYTESSPTNPINVYGETKRGGEVAALEVHPEALVVRTSWLQSGTHPNFVATMLRLVAQGEVEVVDDQHGHPTFVDDLATSTLAAIEQGVSGILHLANRGTVTWYELAREAVKIGGLDPDRVTPCSTEEFPRPARRPENSVLESERLSGLKMDPLPHYRTGLEAAVARLQHPTSGVLAGIRRRP